MASTTAPAPRPFVVGERAVIAGGLLAGRMVEIDRVHAGYYRDGVDQLVTLDVATGAIRVQRADALRRQR